eukprot:621392-Amphidinium_carterae.1
MTEYLLEQAEMRMRRSMGLAKWGNEFAAQFGLGLCKMDGSERKDLLLRHRWIGASEVQSTSEERAAIANATNGNLQDRFQLSRICSCHHLCQSDEDSDAHTPQTKKKTKALASRSSETKRHKRASSAKCVKEKKEDSVKDESENQDAPVMDPAQAVAPKDSKSGNASHPAHPSS